MAGPTLKLTLLVLVLDAAVASSSSALRGRVVDSLRAFPSSLSKGEGLPFGLAQSPELSSSGLTKVWNGLLVPIGNLAFKLEENSTVGACTKPPTKWDETCYVCPSEWYADCDADMKRQGDPGDWVWTGERGGCGFLSAGCNPQCSDISHLDGVTGTLNSMQFGCCLDDVSLSRYECVTEHSAAAWISSAASTSSPDYEAGLTAISGLFSGLTLDNATEVTLGTSADPSKLVLQVSTQNLTSSLPSGSSLQGAVVGLGCTAEFKTGYALSHFVTNASMTMYCPKVGDSPISLWHVESVSFDGLSVRELGLDAIGDGNCYPGGCYASMVCETMQALIPTLGDIIFQIIKDQLFDGSLSDPITGAVSSAVTSALKGKPSPLPCKPA